MPARIMYWNWMTPTAPVPQPPTNYTPRYPNQYCVRPSTYSYPQTNYYQFNYQYQEGNYQQTTYGQMGHQQTNLHQNSYLCKMLIPPRVSLPSRDIPTIVIDDNDDETEVNKRDSSTGHQIKIDLEVTKPNQVKCEVPKDFEDWTELTVKEDTSAYENAVKKENEREWIDWTELDVKEDIDAEGVAKIQSTSEDCIIINSEGSLKQLSLVVDNLKKETISNEEHVIIEDYEEKTTSNIDSVETTSNIDSEERTTLKQSPVVVANLKREPTLNEEFIIIEDSEVTEQLQKGPTEEEEAHREHVTVEELESAPRYPPAEQLKCDYCDYETEWRSCLSRHLTNKHKDITPELNDQEEENPPSTTTTKETADGKFHCPDCSYRTDWKSNLNKHIISRHTTSEKIQWYGCAHCPYKGKTKEYLRVHLVSHGKLGQWHKCPHCTFKSKQRYVVNNHVIVTHTDDEKVKWYKCNHCLYKAKLLANLKKHVANLHVEEDKIKWFMCEHCNYKAKNRKGLSLHTLNRHTGHDQIDWHVCNKCGHKIKTRKNLMQHLKTCKGNGASPPVKSETREVLVYMGDKLCFRRVPVDNSVKHKFCKCKHCKP